MLSSKSWERRRCGTRARCDEQPSVYSRSCRAGWSLRPPIRHALLREQPEVVAVELPMSLEERVHAARSRRLPEISVILYEGETRRSAHLRSGRARRSVHRSGPYRARDGRRGRFHRAGPFSEAAPDGSAPLIRTPFERSAMTAMSRCIARIRCPRDRSNRGAREGAGVAFAGGRSDSTNGGCPVAESLRCGAGRDGDAAGRSRSWPARGGRSTW